MRHKYKKIITLAIIIIGILFSAVFTTFRSAAEPPTSWFGKALYEIGVWLQSVWHVSHKILSYPLFTINDTAITLTNLCFVIFILVAAFMISSHIRKALKRFGQARTTVSEASLFTVGRIIHYAIIAAATVIGFSTLGIDLSQLALVAGALSVGIGFGLQSIFNNFISGLILLFERPLKVGDLIELESGVRGRIKSINVRSTQITTWDNIDILVPNSEFISGRVTNYTFSNDLRRLHVQFGVAYGTDKDLVKQAVLEAAEAIKYTITSAEHQSDVWLVNYGDSSLDYELVVWVQANALPKGVNPKAIYLWEIETRLAKYNIEIPFPQRDLHLKTVTPEFLTRQPVAAAEG